MKKKKNGHPNELSSKDGGESAQRGGGGIWCTVVEGGAREVSAFHALFPPLVNIILYNLYIYFKFS